jgi:signal transduction histidine kinase
MAALDDFVMSLSTALLGVGPDELSPAMSSALGRLCGVLGADRGYVLKTSSDRSAGELFEEWWAPGVERRNTPIPSLPLEAQRFWMRSLRSGEVVAAADLEELDARCAEAADALRRDGVRSILFVPLLAKDDPVGFVGFEGRQVSLEWQPVTVSRIRTVGELLMSAVERCQADAERTAAAQDLAVRNAELERSNRDLEQFASIVSHDLKQPLVVARGFIELLAELAAEHPARGDEAKGYAEAALRGTDRMRALIDDVMALARAGAAVSRPEPVSLDSVTAAVLADLEVGIVDAGAAVSVGALPTVAGNATQLRQLVQNLVANSLKFRHPTRQLSIDISCSEDARGVVVSIADNGIGIEPELRDAVFAMFERANDDAPGLGIGLAVCARVVEAHHGRIWIEGNDAGGSTFCFFLPHHQPTPAS